MADYCTTSQLKDSLGTNQTLMLSDVEDSELTSIISEYSDLIDDYIRSSVSLPFDSTPQIITSICINLSRYECYSRFAAGDIPDPVTKQYDNSFKLLEKIQSGLIKLGTEEVEDNEGDLRYSVSSHFFTGRL